MIREMLALGLLSSTALAIIGGAPAPAGRFPSTVFLLNSGCTGSKIGPRWFLSAEHCRVTGLDEGVALRLQWRLQIDFTAPPFDSQSAAPIMVRVMAPPEELGVDLMAIEVDRDTPQIPVLPIEAAEIAVGRKAYMNGYGCIDPRGMETYDPAYFPYLQKYAVKAISENNDSIVAPGRDFDGVGRSFGCTDDSGGPLYVEAADGSLSLGGVAVSAGSGPDGGTNYERVDDASPGGKWLRQWLR